MLTAARLAVLFASPLELYPDEAQYWVWSRHLAFGYFSKPPMIAWMIRATTAVGGHGEPWVRLSAPLVHAGAALALQRAGQRLYDGRTGLVAAALYILMPGVALSSSIVATDSPLMMFAAAALWAYAALWRSRSDAEARGAALGLGVALGLAMLSKYAALYLVGGAALHAATAPDARRMWTPGRLALAGGVALALAAPNLVWNAQHHFATVAHTADNADWRADRGRLGWLDPRGGVGFVLGQLGVFGPIPFVVLVAGTAAAAARKDLGGADRLLLTLAAPPLLIVLAEAVFARANANWAVIAYAPGAVLTAAFIVRARAWRTLGAGLLIQAAAALAVGLVVLAPTTAMRVTPTAALRRARGWAETTRVIVAVARSAGPISAEAVDDRFLYNAVAYYGRDAAGRPAGALPAPWRAWVREAHPKSQGALEQPLTGALGARVLAVNAVPRYGAAFRGDFTAVEPGGRTVRIRLDPASVRAVTLFVGDRFVPRPRDPHTGLPPGS